MSVAYLDPGSGSLIASVLVGGAAAAGVVAKTARARVTGVFSRKRKSDDDQPESTETVDPAETVEAGDEPASSTSATAGEAETVDTAKTDA